MSDTRWFQRRVGDVVGDLAVYQGSEEGGSPTELLIASSDALPDWVRVPDESPSDPGRQLRVKGSLRAPCPMCKSGNVRHLVTEDGYHVAECGAHGFVWYRRRAT